MARITNGGDVEITIVGNLEGLNKAMNQAEADVRKSFGNLATTAGVAMTAFGGAVVGGLMVAGSKAAEFGKSMANVATLGVKDLDALRTGVEELAMEYGGELNENAKVLYDTISAGIPEDAAIMVLDAAARGAQAGVGSLASALDLGTSAMNAWGLQGTTAIETTRNFEMIMGQAATAIKDGKTTMDEMAQSIGQVAPVMATGGVSTNEFFAAVSALTATGLPAAQAMTQLRAVVSGVIAPTSEAEKVAAELGISFNVAALQSQGLAGFLQEIADKTGGNVETMGKLFGSVEALGAITSLTGMQAEKFAASLGHMADGQKNLNEMSAAYQANNPALAFEQAKAALGVLTVEIGSAALPAFVELLNAVKPVIMALVEFTKENPKLTAGIIGTVGALGAFSLAVGPILIMLPKMAGMFAGITGAASLLGGALGPLIATVIALGTAYMTWNDVVQESIALKQKLAQIENEQTGVTSKSIEVLQEYGIEIDNNKLAMLDRAEQQEAITQIMLEADRRLTEGMAVADDAAYQAYNNIIANANNAAQETASVWSRAWEWITGLWGGSVGVPPAPSPEGFANGGVVGLPGYASAGRIGMDMQPFRWNEKGGEIAVAPVGTRVLDHQTSVAVARDAIASAMGGMGGGGINITIPGMVIHERADVDYFLQRMGDVVQQRLQARGASAQALAGAL